MKVGDEVMAKPKKKKHKAKKKKDDASQIQSGTVASNRKAAFDFKLEDDIVAGIVLTGTEVKSLRNGQAQLKGSYAKIIDGEVFLHNCHIPEYKHGNIHNHEPWRVRKLLLNRREIDKLEAAMQQKRQTLLATKIFFKRSLAKVKLALGTGKKVHDKRTDLKKRAQEREIQQALKNTYR